MKRYPTDDLLLDRRLFTAAVLGAALPSSANARRGETAVASAPGRLVLSNGVVERHLILPTAASSRFATRVLGLAGRSSRLFEEGGSEFAFRLGGRAYDGTTGWRVAGTAPAGDANGGHGVTVSLASADGAVAVGATYLMYPGSAAMRKLLSIRNMSAATAALEDVDVESCPVTWDGSVSGWLYSDYGRRKSIGAFAGGRQDALVALHHPDRGEGLVLGNEAPGVMKYAGFCDGARVFRAGLARSAGAFPFRRWLAPGQAYTTPAVFSIPYADTPRFETVLNTTVPDFVRKHLGTRLARLRQKPTFVYNSWEPFNKAIGDTLIRSLAARAAAAGVETFVIDDGWQDTYGDWNVDRRKFPDGLKPVTRYIRSLGMRPGLWVSIGSAAQDSAVYRTHPEWFARNAAGRHYSIHMNDDPDRRMTACLSTGWRDYIRDLLLRLVAEHGLEYLKLDFAVVTSPYQFDPARTGCYATDHAGHRDHAESLSVNYDRLWEVLDAVKARYPDVFIDCTFETMGGLQLIDYAMLRHAEGNWLSNFSEPGAAGDLRIRQMGWWRSPAMPATSLVLGNPKLSDPGFELHLKSLAGTLPIVLGDLRAMSPAALALSRRYADFFRRMQARHDVFSFRQDLPGFREPEEGGWDGFQRINTDTRSGGLIGVFRHGSPDATRRVRPWLLDPDLRYAVLRMDRTEITYGSGRQLMADGFDVVLPDSYDGVLLEVARR